MSGYNFAQKTLPTIAKSLDDCTISPALEMGAYEALWTRPGASFKTIADIFRSHPTALPSGLVDRQEATKMKDTVLKMIKQTGVERFGVRVHRTGEYPARLREARHPVELLYYRGWWDITETRCVAVVGSRKVSLIGLKRTAQLVRELVKDGFTIVSGLAKGVDTEAHNTAIKMGGNTIAVIGTPINECYPKENKLLQENIAKEFLLISQVPVYLYSKQDYRINRSFFPERNITMSALTEATIIVEASDTSGTLIQARAAINQGRKLFILNSCFDESNGLKWPHKFAEKGAIRVRTYDDIKRNLLAS